MNRRPIRFAPPSAHPTVRAVSAGLLLVAGAVDLTQAAPLSLNDAIRLALQQNGRLATAALSVQRTELNRESALADFDLTLSPAVEATETSDDTGWNYGLKAGKKLPWGTQINVAGAVNRFPDYVTEDWRTGVQVDLQQPLFRNFGRAVNEEPITAAGDQLFAQRRLWEQQKADLIVEVVQSFEKITRLSNQVASDSNQVARTAGLLELTRIRERQGRATRIDSLRAELQHGEALARLDRDRESCFSATQDLAELLGIKNAEAPFELVAPPLPELSLPDSATAIAIAFSNRLDLAQAQQDLATARRLGKLAERRLWPDVTVQARHSRYGDGPSLSDSTSLDDEDWSVGLAAQTELFRRRDKAAARQAAIDVDSSRLSIEILALSITRQVEQARSNYRRARAELDTAGRNYELACTRLEVARHLFEAGRGDHFSVTDADESVVKAEALLLAARAETSVAGYQLLRALGTLLEAPPDLKPRPEELTP
jgi:outer membrane protein TolC